VNILLRAVISVYNSFSVMHSLGSIRFVHRSAPLYYMSWLLDHRNSSPRPTIVSPRILLCAKDSPSYDVLLPTMNSYVFVLSPRPGLQLFSPSLLHLTRNTLVMLRWLSYLPTCMHIKMATAPKACGIWHTYIHTVYMCTALACLPARLPHCPDIPGVGM
jgi:hypothetical protein